MPTPLYTLRAIARELALPESTVRYYRDTFAEFLPAVGRGRRRRYPPETLPLFRLIAEGFAASWSRDDVRAGLIEYLGAADRSADAPPVPPTASHAVVPVPRADLPATASDDVLSVVLRGERERREVLWQMAHELVRLGEAMERQHAVLHEVARQLERWTAGRGEGAGAADDAGASAPELDALRAELARERELVERLRRSKLDLERRAAEAEAALSDGRDRRLHRLFGTRPREADAS